MSNEVTPSWAPLVHDTVRASPFAHWSCSCGAVALKYAAQSELEARDKTRDRTEGGRDEGGEGQAGGKEHNGRG